MQKAQWYPGKTDTEFNVLLVESKPAFEIENTAVTFDRQMWLPSQR
jgi:hypothetical protein